MESAFENCLLGCLTHNLDLFLVFDTEWLLEWVQMFLNLRFMFKFDSENIYRVALSIYFSLGLNHFASDHRLNLICDGFLQSWDETSHQFSLMQFERICYQVWVQFIFLYVVASFASNENSQSGKNCGLVRELSYRVKHLDKKFSIFVSR